MIDKAVAMAIAVMAYAPIDIDSDSLPGLQGDSGRLWVTVPSPQETIRVKSEDGKQLELHCYADGHVEWSYEGGIIP